MEYKKLEDNIYYYTGVIKNPEVIIQKIEELDQYKEIVEVITPWENDRNNRYKKDIFVRALEWFKNSNNPNIQQKTISSQVIEDIEEVIQVAQDSLLKTARHFFEDKKFNKSPNISPLLNICKYEEGGRIGAHFDSEEGDEQLLYTMLIYWNDDYEGGEISFSIMDDNKKYPSTDKEDPSINFWIKPEAGSVLIMPSKFPYLHQSHPIISGNKYVTTTSIFIDGFDIFNEEHLRKYSKTFRENN